MRLGGLFIAGCLVHGEEILFLLLSFFELRLDHGLLFLGLLDLLLDRRLFRSLSRLLGSHDAGLFVQTVLNGRLGLRLLNRLNFLIQFFGIFR